MAPRVQEALAEDGMDGEVADDEGLAELRSGGDEVAVAVEDHGGAVEDELVLAADEVDIAQRRGGVRRPRGEHALALGQDAGAIRGRVQGHDELRAPFPEPADGPRRAPGVLAYGHSDAHTGDQEELVRALAGSEVAPLVEDSVVGEELLVDVPRTSPPAQTAAAL